MFFRVLKLTIIDYWWNGYRKLRKPMKRKNPSPVKWFFTTYSVLRKYA